MTSKIVASVPFRLILATLALALSVTPVQSQQQKRARALGVAPGVLPPGALNTITDVSGVRVGHSTVISGDSIRTGVTAILPHPGNLFQERVPAGVYVGNGFGKLLGSTQVNELGELETPILLTCTLCVWKAADALVAYLLQQEGMGEVRSINPVVGETNDGLLNGIRERPVSAEDVVAAIRDAAGGPVAEGSVGAGTGTVALGWKGGIGTSSRIAGTADRRWTVGVLVQSNFGGDLHIMGVPVGRALGRNGVVEAKDVPGPRESIMIVIATDAPLSDRNLRRAASRAMIGLGRTGSVAANGSGDYVIAFSTSEEVRRRKGEARRSVVDLDNEEMSVVFQAVVEATEEAIYNSLFMATTVASRRGTVQALPVREVLDILRQHGALRR